MRNVCLDCLRPESACYCRHLPSISSRTRVVFLQHPRERRMPIGTARMAHLALTNSELHGGVTFDDVPRLQALARSGQVAVLFPGAHARSPESYAAAPLESLIVLDGTWPQAKKMLKQSPLLQALPRVGFTPRRPGNYRIRKEPAADCLSTIEAVVEVLGALEGDGAKFEPMLTAFERMVDHQIACEQGRVGPPRNRRRVGPPRPRIPVQLLTRSADLVLLYAESNALLFGPDSTVTEPEVVHWVAERPATGERFEAIVRPRAELGEATPLHLEVPRERFLEGERLEDARARFRSFERPDDLWCTWGGYPLTLLKNAGMRAPALLDVRLAVSRKVRGRPGALDEVAQRWELALRPWAQGRAGQRLAALVAVVKAMQEELTAAPEAAPAA